MDLESLIDKISQKQSSHMIPRLSFDLKDIPKKKEFDTVERFL